MRRIIIDVHDTYADIITFVLIGNNFCECKLVSNAADLNKGTYFVVTKDAKVTQKRDDCDAE